MYKSNRFLRALCSARLSLEVERNLETSCRIRPLLPRAHAQEVKQSLSVIVVVVTKIARSGVLSVCSCCNYHELVYIVEKLVSVSLELLNKAH